MDTDALSFHKVERDAWRPYETLSQLTDEQLAQPVEAAHGWSGRDLMGHLVTWQLLSLDVARELAMGERSPSHERADADWEERGGEAVNAEALAEWRAAPIHEVRPGVARGGRAVPGFLTGGPETRGRQHGHQQRLLSAGAAQPHAGRQ